MQLSEISDHTKSAHVSVISKLDLYVFFSASSILLTYIWLWVPAETLCSLYTIYYKP